jgi:16S rRNA (cytidine1402-2'-O)-methyltransferase
VRRAPLADLAAALANEDPPRGEIVLLVGPPVRDPAAAAGNLDGLLEAALGRLGVKDAAAVVAAETGLPRRQVYARAVELTALRRERPDGT